MNGWWWGGESVLSMLRKYICKGKDDSWIPGSREIFCRARIQKVE